MYEYALTSSMAISFQRYPYPPTGFVTVLPTSWGALPFLQSAPGQLVLPCPEGEAFWIGLIRSGPGQHRLQVSVRTESEQRVDAFTGAHSGDTEPADINSLAPSRHGVPGIFRGDGSWWAFARDTGHASAPASLEIELLCRSVEAAAPPRPAEDAGRQRARLGNPEEAPRPHAPESRPTAKSPIDGESSSSARIDVVSPEQFQAVGGIPVRPLGGANHYGGWRLP